MAEFELTRDLNLYSSPTRTGDKMKKISKVILIICVLTFTSTSFAEQVRLFSIDYARESSRVFDNLLDATRRAFNSEENADEIHLKVSSRKISPKVRAYLEGQIDLSRISEQGLSLSRSFTNIRVGAEIESLKKYTIDMIRKKTDVQSYKSGTIYSYSTPYGSQFDYDAVSDGKIFDFHKNVRKTKQARRAFYLKGMRQCEADRDLLESLTSIEDKVSFTAKCESVLVSGRGCNVASWSFGSDCRTKKIEVPQLSVEIEFYD
jgi:hypothetical protein